MRDFLGPFTERGRHTIYGVMAAIVVDNRDPQGLGRVQVRLPGWSDETVCHWARVATLMAGAERGTLFLPEIDDEVLVAFESGDVTHPYVIGALWNGRDKPPVPNADGGNDVRLIKSRSGHQVRFDDSQHGKIEILDKDGVNTITLDTAENTITIRSDGQDGGRIQIEAQRGVIALDARTIEISSSAETKIVAQGGLTLNGRPGRTTLEGQTVHIN